MRWASLVRSALTRRGASGHVSQSDSMRVYMCVICGFVYEEEKGLPDQGIAPGTRWAEIPDTWECPDCGAAKSDFEMIEI